MRSKNAGSLVCKASLRRAIMAIIRGRLELAKYGLFSNSEKISCVFLTEAPSWKPLGGGALLRSHHEHRRFDGFQG